MFRKHELFFLEGLIFFSLVFFGTIILMAIEPKLIMVMLVPALFFLVAIVLQFIIYRDYIIVDEDGITCTDRKYVKWKYKWSEISQLKIGTRLRNPSVEIVLTPDCSSYRPKAETIQPYFQLGRSAKKTIKKFEKTLEKTGDGLREPF